MSRPLGYRVMLIGLFALALCLLSAPVVEGSDWYQTTPTTNNGKKWRIGYYEGGPYINYPANLRALVRGLMQLGWMEETAIAEMEDPTDSKSVWQTMAQARSAYLQFESRAYWSAHWDRDQRVHNKTAAISDLQQNQLDFIIAMGTWAGQDLAGKEHAVPVMVVSASDPVRSGIIKSASYSGFDHVHAKCDPNRYIRQVRLFHNIVGFNRLGIVYENTMAGRTYAAIEDIEMVAARNGFKVVRCEAAWTGTTKEESTRDVIKCHKKLAHRIDALYLTVHQGIDADNMDKILKPLIKHRIPTWSQRGPNEVRDGVLMSISRGGFGPVGMFHATIMAKILNGANPGDLNQIFEDPRHIAVNLKTAKAIGFKPPKGLLMVADEIFK